MFIKNFIKIISFLLLFTPVLSAQIDSFPVKGNMRSYLVHAPAGVLDAPLLISIHGAKGDAFFQRDQTQFDTLADREKFVVVYPNGRYTNGNHNWDYSGDEDVMFLRALIDTMYGRFRIDRSRVYCNGFSLGGMMTYRMACTSADRIAAIVSVSGPTTIRDCAPARPIPVMHIHGLADNTIKYSNAVSTINDWVSRESCKQQAETIEHYPASDPSSKVKYERWAPCNGNSEIILLSVTGCDHSWPTIQNSGFNASEEIWRFFKKHSINASHTTTSQENKARKPWLFSASSVFLIPADAVNVTLFNIQGVVVDRWRLQTADVQETTISLNEYIRKSAGIFLLKIINSDGNISIRRIAPYHK